MSAEFEADCLLYARKVAMMLLATATKRAAASKEQLPPVMAVFGVKESPIITPGVKQPRKWKLMLHDVDPELPPNAWDPMRKKLLDHVGGVGSVLVVEMMAVKTDTEETQKEVAGLLSEGKSLADTDKRVNVLLVQYHGPGGPATAQVVLDENRVAGPVVFLEGWRGLVIPGES